MSLSFSSNARTREAGIPLVVEARNAIARLADGSALSLLEHMVDDLCEARSWYWTTIGDVRRLALAVSLFDGDETHRGRWEQVTARLRTLEEANGDEPTLLYWWGPWNGPDGAVERTA
jgi:hypothetical protein